MLICFICLLANTENLPESEPEPGAQTTGVQAGAPPAERAGSAAPPPLRGSASRRWGIDSTVALTDTRAAAAVGPTLDTVEALINNSISSAPAVTTGETLAAAVGPDNGAQVLLVLLFYHVTIVGN